MTVGSPVPHARLTNVIDERGYDTRIVVFFAEGYSSSLAANQLKRLGLRNVTDLVEGMDAWQRFLSREAAQTKYLFG